MSEPDFPALETDFFMAGPPPEHPAAEPWVKPAEFEPVAVDLEGNALPVAKKKPGDRRWNAKVWDQRKRKRRNAAKSRSRNR